MWQFLAGALVAALAATVSVHAILTKRNVSSAVAWVGLIWLAPVVGPVLYGLLGINRVHRRASSLRSESPGYAAMLSLRTCPPALIEAVLGTEHRHLTAVARLGDRIAGRPLVAGNEIVPLVDGDQAFPAMLAAIDAAERSVTLATYIFDNDRAGRRFRDALRRAVDRGVEVRVLVDDVGARYSFPSMLILLRRARIPVARFMPAVLHWRMPYFNLRNHRKILVVDGRIGFTGGMNLREGCWHALEPAHPIRDLHFRIEGPLVTELQEVFAEDWTFTTGERLEGSRWFPRLEPRGELIARAIGDGPDVDFEKLQSVILAAIGAARRSIRIVTPYFVPDPTLISALNLAALRGVDVRILLPEKNNLALVHWASRAHWWQLLENGCRILLGPPPFDHGKVTIVDGAWTLIGSANWDPRSLVLNFELAVECYDHGFAARAGEIVDARFAAAREITLREMDALSFPVKLRDGLARLASPYL